MLRRFGLAPARLPLALVLAFALGAARCLSAAPVPTPESFFGHKMGADRKVLDWSKVVDYFQVLSKTSDRVRFEDLGQTTEGRPFVLVTVSNTETLRNLDRYRQIQARLADPRRTTPAEAEKLVATGKTIVLITCSIHATEIASTQSAIDFVHDLVTQDTPRHRAILDNTIFLLIPSLNPDGLDLVTAWYRKQLGTQFEGTAPPELYQKYVGHDNNRDWYMFTQAETRLAVSKVHNVWHPQIVYDVHQMGPYEARMFVPPWLDPVEPNVDPVLVQETNMIGTAMAADLTAARKKGVVIHAIYDYWTPARNYQSYHGGMRILSESASARIASPITVSEEQLDVHAPGYNARQSSWNFLEPWRGGDWSLRDIVDYQLVAMESCLYQAALRRPDLLRNFYGIARRAVERKDPPYAFVLPRAQHDPNALTRLLEVLDFGQVEIERAHGLFHAGAKDYQIGDYVVRLAQPYGPFAKALLERQHYPDLREYPGGPPQRPYDATAQTLPLLLGVTADTIDAPFTANLERVRSIGPESGSVQDVSVVALSPALSNSWIAVNRLLGAGAPVHQLPGDGTFLVENSGPAKTMLPALARTLGLAFTAIHLRDMGRPVRSPRIGVYKSWIPNNDEGWTRWVLERFEFPYTSLHNADIRAGNLLANYDVIVLPDSTVASMESGFASAGGNMRGATAMPEEYAGGLGDRGAAALRDFAAGGGVILALNRASLYAISQLGAGARNVLEDISSRDFYAPGSLLMAAVEANHPLTYGMEKEAAVWVESSLAFEPISDGSNPPARAVLQYGGGNLLASGWLLGEKKIAGSGAVMDAPVGKGHVILFGIRPLYRAQSYATFKLFFNALLAYPPKPKP